MTRVLAALASALLLVAAPGRAQLTCTDIAGPPGAQTTATFTVLSPADGAVLRQCNGTVEIEGTWDVSGPAVSYDIYIVIDMSSSTSELSGVDVNGDGQMTRPADDVFRAEIAAARAFVDALDPARSRVAIITFMDITVVWQQLTADLADVHAALTEIERRSATGDTLYVPAMQAVEDEVLANGDPARRSQLCVFLSDGDPRELPASIDASAQELADMGVVIDTFKLGVPVLGHELESMAAITGGRFVEIDLPGDIIPWLPQFVPNSPLSFHASDPASGRLVDVAADVDGTFRVTVGVLAGTNVIALSLRAGATTIVEATCELDLTLEPSVVADAGADATACVGDRIVLDGSRTFSACAAPMYRWIDCVGSEACAGPTAITCEVVGDGTCETYTLEVSCAADGCVDADPAHVTWVAMEPPDPRVTWSCGDTALIERSDAASVRGWDLHLTIDADGDGDPTNDAEGSGDAVIVPSEGGATREIAAWSLEGACGAATIVTVDFTAPFEAVYSTWACFGLVALGIECPPQVTCRWDLDATTDADGDGDPANDVDTGSEFASIRPPGDSVEVVALLTLDGCTSSTPVVVNLVPTTPPRSLSSTACPGEIILLTCDMDLSAESPKWDLDTTSDHDGDGDPGNDVESEQCEISWVADFDRSVRLWRETSSGCEVVAEGVIRIGTGLTPAEVSSQRVSKQDSTMLHAWTLLPGIDDYRVLRGTLASLWTARTYDHGADDAAGAGACDVNGASFSDEDLLLPGNFYYLVTALSTCGGGEGPTGFGREPSGPFARPAGESPSCPSP